MKNRKTIMLLLSGIILLAAVNIALDFCADDSAAIADGATLLDPALEISSFRLKRGGSVVMLAKSSVWRKRYVQRQNGTA